MLETIQLLSSFFGRAKLADADRGEVSGRMMRISLVLSRVVSLIGIPYVAVAWLSLSTVGDKGRLVGWTLLTLVLAITLFATSIWIGSAYKKNQLYPATYVKRYCPTVLALALCWSLLFSFSAPSQYTLVSLVITGHIIGTYIFAFPFYLLLFPSVVIQFSSITIFSIIVGVELYPLWAMSCVLFIILSIIFILAKKWSETLLSSEIVLERQNEMISGMLAEYSQSGNDWLWRIDDNGNYSFLSDNFESNARLDPLLLIGRSLEATLISSIESGSVVIASVSQKVSFSHCKIRLTSGFNSCYWSMSGRAQFDKNGHYKGYLGVCSDISEQERLARVEDELERYESIAEVSAGLSHDFNNILTVILARIELALSEPNTSNNVAIHLDSARTGCLRASHITSQMLAYSKRKRLEPSHVLAREIVLGVVGDVQAKRIGELAIDVTYRVDNSIVVFADHRHLYSALSNTVENAVRAVDGAGEVHIEVEKVCRKPQEDARQLATGAGFVRFRIRDTGPGFDLENLSRIFDPFFTTFREHGGSGLGLSMVKGFVQQSGGEVIAHNIGGAVVDLYLPQGDATQLAAYVLPRGAPWVTLQILVVEDNPNLSGLLEEYLTSSSHKVAVTASVSGAEKYLTTKSFDLVLCDIALEDGSGFDVADFIEKTGSIARILYMTGYLDISKEDRLKSMQVLNKPFSLIQLDKAIAKVMGGADVVGLV